MPTEQIVEGARAATEFLADWERKGRPGVYQSQRRNSDQTGDNSRRYWVDTANVRRLVETIPAESQYFRGEHLSYRLGLGPQDPYGSRVTIGFDRGQTIQTRPA